MRSILYKENVFFIYMSELERLSIMKLEYDILQFRRYRKNYVYYNDKYNETCIPEYKEKYDFWFDKYVNQITYLEETYNKESNNTFHINNYLDNPPSYDESMRISSLIPYD